MAKKARKVAREVTPQDDLKRLLKQCNGHKKNIDELVGSLREKIANAVEKKHLHKKAFALIRQLDRMEPEKLSEFLDHFNHYLDVSGLQERADDAPGLDLDGKEEETDKTNVTRLKVGEAAASPG